MEYNDTYDDNFCTECGQSMGLNNPRQLCRKTYCENKIFNEVVAIEDDDVVTIEDGEATEGVQVSDEAEDTEENE